jgi:hypothetical protein
MRQYKAKTFVDGWRVLPKFTGLKLVAIPEKHARAGEVISCQGRKMILPGEPLHRIAFKDKFNRGFYTLCYYEFVENLEQQRVFF